MCAPFTAASHGFPATARLCIKIAVVSHSKLRKAAVASTAQCPAGCSLDHAPVGYYVIMPLDQPHSNVGLVILSRVARFRAAQFRAAQYRAELLCDAKCPPILISLSLLHSDEM